jgi:hypothetical protein
MIEKIIYRILDQDKPKDTIKVETKIKSKNNYNSLLIPKKNFFVYNSLSKQTNFLIMQEDVDVDIQAMMLENGHLRFNKKEKSEKKEKSRTRTLKLKSLKTNKIEKTNYFDNLNKSNEERYIPIKQII